MNYLAMGARELVLVPKSQFEHLLQQVKDAENTEQSGGRVSEENPVGIDVKTNETTSNEQANNASQDNVSDENITLDESKDKGIESEEKPRLYVDKPLSDMPFENPKFIASRGKMLGKGRRKATKGRKNRQIGGKKKGTKARWINYII